MFSIYVFLIQENPKKCLDYIGMYGLRMNTSPGAHATNKKGIKHTFYINTWNSVKQTSKRCPIWWANFGGGASWDTPSRLLDTKGGSKVLQKWTRSAHIDSTSIAKVMKINVKVVPYHDWPYQCSNIESISSSKRPENQGCNY